MTTENYSVAGYFARTHLANTVRLGGDEQEILSRIGLTTPLLDQPHSRVSPFQLAAIVRENWNISNDELMGLASHEIKVGVFSLLAERLIQCDSLGDVFAETANFYNLITDALYFQNSQTAESFRLSITLAGQPLQQNPSLLIEFLLLIWHRFPSWLIGQAIPLKQVEFSYPEPPHSNEYRLMFPCTCHYSSANNAIIFNADLLALPVIQSAETLREYLSDIPLQWFRKQAFYDSCTTTVIRMLDETLSHEKNNLEFIAETLHMTSRTLRRKLAIEGSNFQQLKDNIRRDKAINLLSDSRIAIAEIGRLTGFTEAAAFTRAFKHWTGVPPASYRKGLHKSS